MDNLNHTKVITLKRPFSFEGVSIAEEYKLRNMFEQMMQQGAKDVRWMKADV